MLPGAIEEVSEEANISEVEARKPKRKIKVID
jgi:hypothetical protein